MLKMQEVATKEPGGGGLIEREEERKRVQTPLLARMINKSMPHKYSIMRQMLQEKLSAQKTEDTATQLKLMKEPRKTKSESIIIRSLQIPYRLNQRTAKKKLVSNDRSHISLR